jgi:electron transfer flavoprotein alpha/beta subunit
MSLRVLVQVWCEIDPTLNVRLERQSSRPLAEAGDQLWRVSPLGRAGITAALGLGATVTAFALGTEHAPALRHALASGAAEAIQLVADVGPNDVIPIPVLAEWLRGQHADLVIADRLAGLVAARLNWAHLAGLDELHMQDGALHAVRFLGRGDGEEVRASLPAAVRLRGDSLRAPYVSRSRILAIADRTIRQQSLSGLAACSIAPGQLQIARPRTRLNPISAPTATSASGRLEALMGGGTIPAAAAPRGSKPDATPEELAEEFVRYLLHHQLLPNT